MTKRARLILLTTLSLVPPPALVSGAEDEPRDSSMDCDQFGHSVASVGDVNGDGVADVAVGAYLTQDSKGRYVGAAFVFSGATGELLWKCRGDGRDPDSGRAEHLGKIVASAGDVDGDGRPDVLVGSESGFEEFGLCNDGKVRVFRGDSGLLLRTLPHNDYHDYIADGFASVGDTNADGVPDIAVASRCPDEAAGTEYLRSCVTVHSGKDGRRLLTVRAGEPVVWFGRRVAALGDIDRDGRADFVVGAMLEGTDPRRRRGRLVAVSGGTGSTLWRRDSATDTGWFGDAITCIGDVDGDRLPDLAVGDPQEAIGGKERAGQVTVLSGKDGSVLFRRGGPCALAQVGTALSPLGDVNRDGIPDFLVGAVGVGGPDGAHFYMDRVWVLSGKDGWVLQERAQDGESRFGESLAGLGDLDGDGCPDFAVGAAPDLAPGKVLLCSGRTLKTLRVIRRPLR